MFPKALEEKLLKTWYNQNLNEYQKEAVIHSLKSKDISVIHGPPGTGKTTTLVEFIKKACIDVGAKVLCCAPSNIAVDNIAEKLIEGEGSLNVVRIGHPARLLESVQNRCLDALVQKADATEIAQESKRDLHKVLNELRKEKDRGKIQELREERNLLRKDVKEFEKKAVKEIFSSAQVILSTTTMAGDSKLFKFCQNLPGKTLDIVVIDEWAQATEPSCWIPLQYAKKAVFAGDHKQLEPTIKSIEASKGGLSNTLFEQVITSHPEISKMLKMQYRMNEKIMKWSSDTMYDSELIAAPSVASHLLSDFFSQNTFVLPPTCTDTEDHESFLVNSLVFVDTSFWKMFEGVEVETLSKFNLGEATLVGVVYQKLLEIGLSHKDVGIITPYNAQATIVRKELRKADLKLCEVSTVDGFQGREKEVVIVSMVRSNYKKEVGFLKNRRRMNVAVTRAKRLCVLIGDADTVSKGNVWGDV